MTLPLYFVGDGALATVGAGADVVLDGPEGRHAATVKRARPGEQLLLADGSGRRARVEVLDVEGSALRLRVVDVEEVPAERPRLVLAQALAKHGRDEQAIEAATELGVDAVLAWQARRSVVVWRADRVAKSLTKWRTLVTAASKQSRRATVPEVSGPVTTGALAEAASRAALTLVLHEDATERLAGVVLPEEGDVLVVVGPEGGVDPDELDALVAAGARPVRLGDTVLRSSSAGPAALAVLCAQTRWR